MSKRSSTPEPSEFGSYLRSLRKKAGLTKADIERSVGVDRSFLFRIENGKAKTGGIETLTKLARAYDVDPTDLLRMAGHDIEQAGLPALRPYLRQTQDLSPNQTAKVEEYIKFIKSQSEETPPPEQ